MNNLNEQTGELPSGEGDPSVVTILASEEEQIETGLNSQDAQGASQPPTNGGVEIDNHTSAGLRSISRKNGPKSQNM